MTTLAAEFGASRLLQMRFSSINLVWATIIGLILVYLAMGYSIGGRWADKSPYPRTMFAIMAWGGFSLGLIPFIAQPVLVAAASASDQLNLGIMAGAFISTLILFSIPVTLLAMVSPFAIRISMVDATKAGDVAGRLYSVSTLGSVLGAFLPSLLLFPVIGTSRTILVFGIATLAIALFGLIRADGWKKSIPFVLMLVALGAIIAFGDFHVKDTPGQVYETESDYNYIEVIKNGEYTYLRLNDGQGVHSEYHPTELFYGGPWEQFLVGPLFNETAFTPEQVKRIAIVGLAAGTTARQATAVYGNIPIDGYEIDPKIVAVGQKYFDMTMPNLNIHVTDGRWGLEHSGQLYDIIAIDAYRPPYIPPNLTTREFFQICADHLTPNGALVINIGLNFLVVPRFGIVGLAAATATTATLNVLTLYTILQMRGWFHVTGKLAGRIGRQLIATAAMSAALWALMPLMASRYGGNVFERVWSLGVLVASGLVVFFAVAWVVGALDKDLIGQLKRKRPPKQAVDLAE